MPNSNLHVNQPLTNISIEYKNESYIADQVIPALPVAKSSDLYYIYTTDFKLPETTRAYGSESKQATWGVSTASYRLEWHSLKDSVIDKDRENADAPLSLDADTTAFLTDKIDLRKEQRAAQLLFTTTNWSNSRSITATAESWHTSGAFPVQAVISVASLVLLASGKVPNVGVMGKEAYDITRENTNITGRIQYVERAIVTPEILAALFDLNKIHVGTAILDTGQEGVTVTSGYVWGDDFFLGYMAPTPGRKMASAAYKLTKSGGRTVKKWRDEKIEGDWIEVSEEYKFRGVASACGAIIKNVNLP
jgi:hypothetical protein